MKKDSQVLSEERKSNGMRIMVINGPNLNMLGIREPEIYGRINYEGLCEQIVLWGRELWQDVEVYQSNCEGEIIEYIHHAYYENVDGVVINAGAYTHYSYAIRDALAILKVPVVEIHISNIYEREDFRKISVISDVSSKQIVGKGILGYKEALEFFTKQEV